MFSMLRQRLACSRPPVLFLDIDGVLAPFDHRQPDMTPAHVGGWQGTVLYSPSIVARIRDLHNAGLVEVRWLTSWDEDAPQLFAPATGLGDYVGYNEPSTGTGYWKEHIVRTFAATGRRFIWLDDEMVDHPTSRELAAETDGQGLCIAPDPRIGLTPAHMDTVERFARS